MNDVAHDNVTVPSVLVIGGGFAGVGCATELAKHDVHVTLIDRNNYHQFQPLLYQVATGELAASDVARPLRDVFANRPTVTVLQAEIDAVDVDRLNVTTTGGQTHSADYLVLAAGSVPNYFGVPGADEHAFALYSVADAKRLRSRLFECFEDAAANPARIDEGALNIVIVGAGPTGVETAGAVADLVNEVMPDRYRNLDLTRASIRLVDHGPVVLGAFSDKAHRYAARKLEELGVELLLQRGVKEVRADRVVLDDDSEILTHVVVWAGGTKPPALTANTGLPTGRGGRLDALADLTAEGHPRVYPIGDMANTIDRDGTSLPALGSVALQAGRWAAHNIVADIHGRERTPFKYLDKGIMAMISRGSAVAEVGPRHHELHGVVAFSAWLGVHAWLMSGIRQRVDAFVSWGWDFLGSSRGGAQIDPDEGVIDWGDEA
jgi:NADH dehydrogenase